MEDQRNVLEQLNDFLSKQGLKINFLSKQVGISPNTLYCFRSGSRLLSTIKQITLRQHGFSWSSVDEVWERRLSWEAIHAAAFIKFVRPLSGVSPEKLQPYVQQKRGREDR